MTRHISRGSQKSCLDHNTNIISFTLNNFINNNNNHVSLNNIKVFVDGDEGIKIERCVSFNRRLYKLIEEAALYPEGDFSLEVSSPGIEEPLKLHRQYTKNIGRTIETQLLDGTIKEGLLETVTENEVTIIHTAGKGKKAITEQLVIPFINIKSTTVQIKF